MTHSPEDTADREGNELNELLRLALEEREALLKEKARVLKRSYGGKKRS